MNDFVPQSQNGPPADSRSLSPLTWREAQPRDAAIVTILEECWSGRRIPPGVCPQLLDHLGDTNLTVEDRGELVAVLVGHLSRRASDAGYVHCAGMHPDYRGGGVGDEMYRRCAAVVRECGPISIVAETGAWSRGCIAFHTRRRFALGPSDDIVDGLPVHRDTTGFGFEHVRMVQCLDEGGGA